ncbi:FAD-dependent monooxygenase [Rhodococcus sp. G-MC3]|uniref:FAD-dependent monooxygenase n=1 Tax=Rhodococcus sp. G-MC3 TaxID=3046209 RepID=UPI0024B91730|nr:FAD-dependent monooxygenase [Rhodococcus sp. G-MC3]MDJ0392501.1 FAD-dependent monooxygenase [Rhodococcus sp. G-MC3]
MDHADVIVVGAGPAGCMLAGELASAGRSVLVLDKHSALSPLSRAFGVHARTLEVLDSRGMADELLTTGARVGGLKLWNDTTLDLTVLPSKYPFLLSTPQTNVDSLLERYARGAGAQIRRGVTVTGVEQNDAGARVHGTTARGEATTWSADYVVGADGVRSVVREAIGQEFHGRALLQSIMLADVTLANPPQGVINIDAGRDCFAFVAPFGDGWYRVITWDRADTSSDEDPIDETSMRDVLTRALGTDFGWTDVRWTSRFRCDERQVDQYRIGRVLLVGDAAHVHSPAGAQGMNTGIQDSFNLGWKLAAVLGGADESILDTYQSERHPVGKLVLKTSGATIRMLLLKSRVAQWVRNHVIGKALRTPRIATRIAAMFSGVAIEYGHGGPHRLIGTRAPQDEGLAEALRAGRFVLVCQTNDPDVVFEGPVLRVPGDGPALLVRPDGYVAWAGSIASGAAGAGGWHDALSQWGGQRPAHSRAL